MKSILTKKIIKLTWSPQLVSTDGTFTVELTVRENSGQAAPVVYSGTFYTTKNSALLDLTDILDSYEHHSVNETIGVLANKEPSFLYLVDIRPLVVFSVNGVPQQPALFQYFPLPELYDFTVNSKGPEQALISCFNTTTDGVPVYRVDGGTWQYFSDNSSYDFGHFIVAGTVDSFGATSKVEFALLKGGQYTDIRTLWTLGEGCSSGNLYLYTNDKIQYFDFTVDRPTFTNRKSSFTNRFGDVVTYKNDVNYNYNLIIDADYSRELLEDLNDNLGCIVTLDGTVNYGIIDESSIKTERHKQAFKLKI